MKRLLPCYILLLFSCSSAAAQTKFLRTAGTTLKDSTGKTFVMKGTNLGNWLVPEGYMFKFKHTSSPRLIQELVNQLLGPAGADSFWQVYLQQYITREDIRFLRNSGMNSLRLPFHYKIFTDEYYLGGRGAERGFALVDSVVNWCRETGMYLLLDMHCAPGGQTGDNIDDSWGMPFLMESRESQLQTIAIWKMIAEHYRNEPVILGYDLLNEPIATYFDTARFNKHLLPLYREITDAVRSVDKEHIIFYGGAQWNSNFRVFGRPFDNNAVYSFHKYWTEPTRKVIQDYLDFSARYQVPLHCGETGENTDEWVQQFREILDSNGIGWHYWPYKKLNNTRGIVSFNMPAGFDQVIAFADTNRSTFEQVRKLRPTDEAATRKALYGFLENCRFANCYPNKGYMRALNFNPDQQNRPR